MTINAFDDNNEPITVPLTTVACATEDCGNYGIEIAVPDDPNGYAVCGGGCLGILRVGTNVTLETEAT